MKILFLATVSYNSPRQRPQQLADRLGATYVSPWTPGKASNKRAFLLPYNARNPIVRRIARMLVPLRFIFGWFTASSLPVHNIVIVQSYHWYPVVRWLDSVVIYDRIDNEDGWFNIPGDYGRLVSRAEMLTSSHEGLGGYVIPNGVDTDLWQWRPVIAYHGVVDSWFDTDLLDECAQAMFDHTFLIVGPVKVAVPKRWNIVYTGEIPHECLPAILQGVSCGIIPFKVNKLTATVSPVKLQEYHALGIPVLATPFTTLDCATAARERFVDELKWIAQTGRGKYTVQTWDDSTKAMVKMIADYQVHPWWYTE